jgi:hypothetical protein
MATAKKETTKATKVTPALPGQAKAKGHAGSLLIGATTVRDAAHDILRDTGMVDASDAWVGFPEGFASMLKVAEAITPQPTHKVNGKRVRVQKPDVTFIPYRKILTGTHTPAEAQHSKDVQTVADALSKVSVFYGRPTNSRPGSADAATGNAPRVTVQAKDAAQAS